MTDRELFELAAKAMDNAYAPYSHFKVGACVLSEDGRAFTGCNIENASFGGTICAERTALVKGVSEGARRFTAVAVAAEDAIPWPCGICRQMLNEFSLDMKVICGSRATGAFTVVPLKDLLPHSFGPEDLK